jgi:excisionase family DNA binding protein
MAIVQRMDYIPPDPEPMLTIGDAAKQLGVSVETIRRWSRKGMIVAQQVGTGGHRRFPISEIERLKTGAAA